MAKKKKAMSEIDSFAVLSRKMTCEEIDEYVHTQFTKDMQFFNRILKEQEEVHEWIKTDPQIQPLLASIKSFYGDLVSDGHIKKDLSLLDFDKMKNMQVCQSREEYTELLGESRLSENTEYHEPFRKLNRAYVINYECVIDEYLVSPAEKILGRKILNKGQVLNIINSYKRGKYAELLRSLIPQIRNGVQHQNFLIDPKQPKITFFDRSKKPLSLTLEEYRKICSRNLCLILSFDVAHYELANNLLRVLLEAANTVDEFLKKHNLRISPSDKEKGLSIVDLASLIKSGKLGI